MLCDPREFQVRASGSEMYGDVVGMMKLSPSGLFWQPLSFGARGQGTLFNLVPESYTTSLKTQRPKNHSHLAALNPGP